MTRKRHLIRFTLIALLFYTLFFSLFFSLGNSAHAGQILNGFEIENGVLVKYHGNEEIVTIPDNVSVIGYQAFGDRSAAWGDEPYKIRKIIIPSSVRIIEHNAFTIPSSLEEVQLSEGLVEIGQKAFGNCYKLKKITIPKSVKTIGSDAIYAYGPIVSVYRNTAGYRYVSENMSMQYVNVVDALDIADAVVTFGKESYVYRDKEIYPEKMTLTLNGITLIKDQDYKITEYADNKEVGFGKVVFQAITGTSGTYKGSKEASFQIRPRRVAALVSTRNTTDKTVELTWKKNTEATGYLIYRYDKTKKTWTQIASVKNNKYKDNGRKAETTYTYAVCAYTSVNDTKIYGTRSNTLEVTTLPTAKSIKANNKKVNAGQKAEIKAKDTNVQVEMDSTMRGGNHANISPVSQFLDEKGNYCYAYVKGSYVIIRKVTSSLKNSKTIKIRRKYPAFGSIACDQNGNYYIVWGQGNIAKKAGVETLAISKYNSKGKLIKTTKYVSSVGNGLSVYNTANPFYAGNCVINIHGDTLVCSLARYMFNGHQSNTVISVNIKTMQKITDFSNYVSHSFNQGLLSTSSGAIVFLNQGDAYGRGFNVEMQYYADTDDTEGAQEDCKLGIYDILNNKKSISVMPFGFYGQIGDNGTGAEMGGIVETSNGYMLCGSSKRSLTKAWTSESKDLFVQILDKSDLSTISSGSKRTGTVGTKKTTNTGVIWLTNYAKKYNAMAVSITAIDDDRVVIMWEKCKGEVYVDSYYMILSASGKVLQKATSLGHRRMNIYEEPVYSNGYIYWSSCADCATVRTYRLNVRKMVSVKTIKAPKVKTIKEPSMRAAYIYWEPVDDADGFEVYCSTTPNGSCTKVGDVTEVYMEIPYNDGAAYYYKVRAYNKSGKKTLNSAFSKVIAG